MSYAMTALMQQDRWLVLRLTACAAREGIPQPSTWVGERLWELVAQPGWAEMWEAGRAVRATPTPGLADIGFDPAVISDAAILASVQLLRGPADPGEGEDPEEQEPDE